MIHGIQISPSELVVKQQGASGGKLSFLKNNQLVEAKVLNVMGQDRAEVLIAGKRVIVKSPFLLKEGDILDLTVIRAKAPPVLKLVSAGESAVTGRMASLADLVSKLDFFPRTEKTGETKLLDILNTIALKSDKADEEFVPRLLERGGFLLEKKLLSLLRQNPDAVPHKNSPLPAVDNDLKARVLQLLESAGFRESPNAKTFSNIAAGIENVQILNSHSSDTGRYLIPFPVFADDAWSFGQLLIDLGAEASESGDNGDKEKVVNVSLLLNMSNLGALRADFSLFKKALSGSFKLSDETAVAFVRDLLPDLKERLAAKGYTVRNIVCEKASGEEVDCAAFAEQVISGEADDRLHVVI